MVGSSERGGSFSVLMGTELDVCLILFFFFKCTSSVRNLANVHILYSPVRPCSPFSDSRWHPPLFPGFPEAGPSAPPSPSSPPPGPRGPRPCLPAPVACLSGQFTPVGRKENKRRTPAAAARLYLPSLLFITEMERLSSATAWLYWRFKP